MKRWIKYLIGFVLLTPIAVLLIFKSFGFYINSSPSMPMGLWRIEEKNPIQNARIGVVMLKRGSIALSKKGESNMAVIKRVAGFPGDIISYDPVQKVLSVNGHVLEETEIFLKDNQGVGLPQISYPITVPAGHVWLSSKHLHGYDSRYFGSVPVTSIDNYLKPVFLY